MSYDAGTPGHPDVFDPAQPGPHLSLDSALTWGWRGLKGSYGPLLAIVAINLAIALALWLLQMALNTVPFLGLAVSLLTSIFLSMPIGAGIAYAGVKAVQGEPLQPQDAFLGFTRYWNIVAIGVLNMLITIACMAPFGCVIGIAMGGLGAAIRGGSNSPVGLAAVIICVVVMIVLMLMITTRLSFAQMVCLDPRWRRTDPIECLKTSWRMTRSCWGTLILLYIVVGLIAALSILLLGVGLILLGWPLSICVVGAAYVLITMPYFAGRCSNCGTELGEGDGPCPNCGQ